MGATLFCVDCGNAENKKDLFLVQRFWKNWHGAGWVCFWWCNLFFFQSDIQDTHIQHFKKLIKTQMEHRSME